jgi:hypothetical protein
MDGNDRKRQDDSRLRVRREDGRKAGTEPFEPAGKIGGLMHLNNLKGKYAGDVCTVIGNGPSLRGVTNDFLSKYVNFGSNRIYLRFVPDFYVCVNPLVIEQNRDDITALDTVKFIRGGECGGFPLKSVGKQSFSFEPDKWIYEGYTVTYVSLQLAFWMGFTTVLLVGVDHRYKFEGKPNERKLMKGKDPNHFDPKYFKGQEWNNPDLMRSAQAYRLANTAYGMHGRKIINLTEGSDLDVFTRGDIREWM